MHPEQIQAILDAVGAHSAEILPAIGVIVCGGVSIIANRLAMLDYNERDVCPHHAARFDYLRGSSIAHCGLACAFLLGIVAPEVCPSFQAMAVGSVVVSWLVAARGAARRLSGGWHPFDDVVPRAHIQHAQFRRRH